MARLIRPGDLEKGGVRKTDPKTSHEAAVGFKKHRERDRDMVLKEFYHVGGWGMIDHELEARTKRQRNSVGKRRRELEDLGMVKKLDREYRLTPSGCKSQVYVITAYGARVVEEMMKQGGPNANAEKALVRDSR